MSLGVEGRQYSGDGEFRSGMFTLRFSLPWANRDKYRKDYERDKERQKSAEQEREDQVLMVREELHHLAVGIEAMRRESLVAQRRNHHARRAGAHEPTRRNGRPDAARFAMCSTRGACCSKAN